jgi:methylated-DNA-[protein]-cysteine S-methyltransferase
MATPLPTFTIPTPFHHLGVTTADGQVIGIAMVDDTICRPPSNPSEVAIAREIEAYCHDPSHGWQFSVRLQGSHFQQRVWKLLQSIPPGATRSYGSLAASLGTSARAVGNACRRNPLLLVVPCHRVVAATSLGGFSGERDGRLLNVKRALLAHEGAITNWDHQPSTGSCMLAADSTESR